MKKLLLGLLSICFLTTTIYAQNVPPASMSDVDFSLVSWERGEVLVRIADNLNPSLNPSKSETKISAIDDILADYQGVKLEQLFPVQKPIPGGEKGFTTYSGKYYEYPKLTNIYKVSIKDTTYGAIFPLITALENLGDDYVVYAEPNYHFETDVSTTPTDPLYQYQYNTEQMNADSVWSIMADSSITEEDIVIAILDTGVDTAHVDLKGKKHLNMLEVNGQPGVDDDGNGFIDDISGWDHVNLDNAPLDDNLHGTHCATIAVANHDSIGIAGVAPNAKYMALKCLESSGYGNSATIAQSIVYAANNGADVISMSLGGYGRSLAQENALGYAYAFAMIVASAGNDAICIRNDGKLCPDGKPPRPAYPGAYTFVLGVQATMENPSWSGYRVGFSNYDFDGPAYTDYGDDFNYEVYAPGTSIMGGLPNNGFTYLSGTSMSAPAVAGAVAIYKAFRPNNSNDRTFVDFIKSWYEPSGLFNKSGGYPFKSVDLVKAIYPEIGPMMWMDDFTVIDSIWGDGDGKLDAGELVQVRVDMKNVGHYTDSVLVGIRMSQFEDKSVVNYEDSVSVLTSISSYATVSNNTALFKLRVDSNVVNGRDIVFNIYSIYPNGDTTSQDHIEQAQSGCEYNGIYSGTVEWGPECGIIVTGNTYIDTLIIRPGTHIQMDGQVGLAYNHIVCEGTQDSMITFTKNINDYQLWSGITSFRDDALFKYTIFEYGWPRTSDQLVGPGNKVSFEDCVFRFNEHYYGSTYTGNHITLKGSQYAKRCNFEYNTAESHIIGLEDDNWTGSFENNIIAGNLTYGWNEPLACLSIRTVNDLNRIKLNTFLRHRQQVYPLDINEGFPVGIRWGNGGGHALPTFQVLTLDSNYFGTTSNSRIDELMFDFTENPNYPPINAYSKAQNRPSSETHGHVWKIDLDTVGVNILNNPIHYQVGLGTHRVRVYFNRPMDIEVTPFVTFGVRQPYTQNIVGDSTSWSSDSLIWTGYFTVDQATSSDGNNKIAVRNALDNEGFSIPIEDYRFEFKLDVATSLSNGFTAYGDTSQINMFWNGPDSIVDLIGYNIYKRDTTDGNGDTLLINATLIQDTTFFDENVVGGQWYQYFYTSLRSNFTESQISKGVWATPYSSKPRVKTLKAEETSKGTIKFNAKVDANFITTEARFLYGTSPTNLNAATAWENVGSNYYEVDYDRSISSVSAGTVYYYKVQAQNSLGIETGKLDSVLTEDTPTLTISGATQICLGDSISLSVQTVTLDTTMSLTWKYNGSTIGQGTTVKYLPSTHGTYSIDLVAEGSFTTTTSKTYDVTVINGAANSVAITYSGSTQMCQGESLTLNLPSGYTDIVWNTGDTTSTITATQTGAYSATMKTSGAGCSVSSGTVNVTVSANPTATVSSTSGNSICNGTSADLTAPTGMSSYEWYNGGTQIVGANNNTISVSTAGNYQVKVTNSDGCSTLSSAYGMTVNPVPTGSISNASSLEFCEGDSVVLSGPTGMTYAWSTGETTSSISVSNTATIGLTVTNTDGCSAALTAVDVIANQVPSLTVSNGGALEFCFGGSVNLQASGGFASYAWSNGSTNQNIIATTAGNYTVTGTTSDGCSATSAVTSVTVNANPLATITNAGSSVLCAGDSTTLSAPSGMSAYLWSDGSTTQSITTSTAASYSVTVTNADGCSATSASTAVTASAIAAPMVTSNGPLAFCDGGSVSLAVPMGYSSFMWNNGSGFSQITVNASGDYYAQVMNADGCSATSDTVTVEVFPTPPTPSISYTANDTLMTSSEAVGNQWYFNGNPMPGETNQTLRPLNLGNYSLRIIDTNGCEGDMSAMQFYNSIGMEENLADQIALYPNPTQGRVTLELNQLEVASLRVVDATGRTVIDREGCTGVCELDLSNTSSGMYQIILITTEGGQIIKPIIVNR